MRIVVLVGWAQIGRIADLDAKGAREAGERHGWRESTERSDVPIIGTCDGHAALCPSY
jgi:hypothetical protein